MATIAYSCRPGSVSVLARPEVEASRHFQRLQHSLQHGAVKARPACFSTRHVACGKRRLTIGLAGKAEDGPMNPNNMYERIMKAIGARFVALKNEGNLQEIFGLCSPEVDLYGTQGLDAASKSLTTYFSLHPELHHLVKEEDYQIMGKGIVGYKFVKTWRDKETGQRMEWISFANGRNKVEKIHLGQDGRIVKVEVVEAS